jgi:HPt (histidine-containing phosphotransfer) domain-containing protein
VAEVTAPSPLAPEPDRNRPEPASAPHPEQAETEAEAADLSDDEQIKVIGDLRIGIPLYNVYLNEADEWSRHLLTELSEWELELDRPLRDSTIGLAHSLAGSSGTVGFMALSEIARLLEHALAHVQLHGQSRAQDARVFNQAAEDIRRLLHQFAAGFLKQPDPAIREALQAILDTEFASDDEAAAPDSGLSFDTLDTVQPGIDAVAFREPVVAPPAQRPRRDRQRRGAGSPGRRGADRCGRRAGPGPVPGVRGGSRRPVPAARRCLAAVGRATGQPRRPARDAAGAAHAQGQRAAGRRDAPGRDGAPAGVRHRKPGLGIRRGRADRADAGPLRWPAGGVRRSAQV